MEHPFQHRRVGCVCSHNAEASCSFGAFVVRFATVLRCAYAYRVGVVGEAESNRKSVAFKALLPTFASPDRWGKVLLELYELLSNLHVVFDYGLLLNLCAVDVLLVMFFQNIKVLRGF